jgi:hypothetical protein
VAGWSVPSEAVFRDEPPRILMYVSSGWSVYKGISVYRSIFEDFLGRRGDSSVES